MLMTRMTPNVIASPRAVRIRIELKLRLLERASPKVGDIHCESNGPLTKGGTGMVQPRRASGARVDFRAPLASRLNDRSGYLPHDLTRLPFVTPPLVQSQLQPGKATCGYGSGSIELGLVDDVELLVVPDLAHEEGLVDVLVLGVDLDLAAPGRRTRCRP